MPQVWADFVQQFQPVCPDLFARAPVQALGHRLLRAAEWVDRQLWGGAGAGPGARAAQFRTLVHGDFKAMNAFVPRDGGALRAPPQPAMAIDFQWTGCGFGMQDVAYHLSHSGPLEAMADSAAEGGEHAAADAAGAATGALGAGAPGACAPAASEGLAVGEEALIRHYYRCLRRLLRDEGKGRAAEEYTYAVALRHYKLSVLDYARVVVSCFYRGASPEAFAKKAGNMNCSLVYRSVPAALAFVRRLDAFLGEFEAEAGFPAPGAPVDGGT